MNENDDQRAKEGVDKDQASSDGVLTKDIGESGDTRLLQWPPAVRKGGKALRDAKLSQYVAEVGAEQSHQNYQVSIHAYCPIRNSPL